MSELRCISEPVSHLALEQFLLSGRESEKHQHIADHLAQCAACRAMSQAIASDQVALPALLIKVEPASVVNLSEERSKRMKRSNRALYFAAVPLLTAAAAVLLWIAVKKPTEERGANGVKGSDEVTLVLARERNNQVALEVTTYLPGDRWKALVTCAPNQANGGNVAVDLVVFERTSQGFSPSYPIAPTQIACGNSVAVPGAFSIAGGAPHVVCLLTGATSAARTALAPGSDMACVELQAE